MDASFKMYRLIDSEEEQIQELSNPHQELTMGSSDLVIDPNTKLFAPSQTLPYFH